MRDDSRTRGDSRQGSVGSMSPGPHARDFRGKAVRAPGNLPSYDIDEASARASMRHRGVDGDGEMLST